MGTCGPYKASLYPRGLDAGDCCFTDDADFDLAQLGSGLAIRVAKDHLWFLSADAIAVDLRGNVMTCQNTGAKGAHKIGHVTEFDAIALDTAKHFAFREECMSCPVVQLCKGSCMFLEGEFFKQSCANEFAFNMGIMMAAVWHLTGMVVVGVATEHSV
jgi:radical SAM protein with 4Fe4S-binding SPASM domain